MKKFPSLGTLVLLLVLTGLLYSQNGDGDRENSGYHNYPFWETRFLGIANRYRQDFTGIQVGIASNRVDGDLAGLQISGLANVTEGSAVGLQLTGLANVVGGNVAGAQIAGLASVTGEDAGLQLSGLASVAGGNSFIQLAGLASITGSTVHVGQVAGLVSVAATGSPVQISGLVSVAAGKTAFLQMSGVANVSEQDVGLQVSGLANVTGETVWGQIGIVNVAPKVKLFQIGIVNVASTNRGIPIGMINVIDGNPMRYSIMVDGFGQATASLRSGNRHFYTAIGFQGGEDATLQRLGSMLSGFGVSLPVKRAYISAEYLLNQRFETFDHLEQTVGLRAGLRITRYFGLAAGAAVPLDDLIGGSSFDALPNGWSIGLEWYRPTRLDLSTGW